MEKMGDSSSENRTDSDQRLRAAYLVQHLGKPRDKRPSYRQYRPQHEGGLCSFRGGHLAFRGFGVQVVDDAVDDGVDGDRQPPRSRACPPAASMRPDEPGRTTREGQDTATICLILSAFMRFSLLEAMYRSDVAIIY